MSNKNKPLKQRITKKKIEPISLHWKVITDNKLLKKYIYWDKKIKK